MNTQDWCPTCTRMLPTGASLTSAKADFLEAVRETLSQHIWTPRKVGPAECWSADDEHRCGARFTIGGEYRTHVAEIIAGLAFSPGLDDLRCGNCDCQQGCGS